MALDLLLGRPLIEKQPSGLRKITRFWKINGESAKVAAIETAAFDAYGTADVEFPTALLIDQRLERRAEQGEELTLIKVYQELADNALTATTEVVETTTFDGRRVTRTTYICRSEDAATLRPAISSTVFQVEIQKNGPVAIVHKFEIALTDMGFVLSDSTDTRHNGALVVRTIRTLGEIAGTPATFTLITTSEQNVDGYTVFTATFAKGSGTVTTSVQQQNNGKLVIYQITALGTAPSAPAATIGGTVVSTQTNVREADGYQVFDYVWAEGSGEIGRSNTYQQSSDQGTTGSTLTTIQHMVAPLATVQPTTLSGFVRVGEDYDEGEGYRIWTTKWAKGTGLVAQNIHARQDGLREVTNIALGTRSAPAGAVIRDDYRIDDGFTVFTVTAIQTADGSGTVTNATVAFERFVEFLYPGRIKAYSVEADDGWFAYDVYKSPPAKTDILATITVTYQTSNALGTITDYWNPTAWATSRAEWIGTGNIPAYDVRPHPGYRAVDDTPLTFTASVWAGDSAGTMLGNNVFGGTTAILQVSGGPEEPDGNSYTLDATLEPAFTATDGTKYYRQTVVTATIPAQEALPV